MMKNAVEEKAYENQEAYQRTQMQKDMILERLREQGCRITRQRQLILDIILEEECSCCKEIYYKVQEKVSRIDLNKFTRMSGDEEYSYDMESTEYNSLDYQFMADFEESEEKAEEGLYQLGFIASDSSEEVKVCQMELEVQVVPGKTYDLEIRESEER